jgi:hypothetical protein
MCTAHPVVLPRYEDQPPTPRLGAARAHRRDTPATPSEHRRVYKQTSAFVVESLAGAGNGIRTRDPDLGKVVLYH